MKLNQKTDDPIFTYEGGKAKKITPLRALERSVMSCLLWEDEFYEDGVKIADRIVELAMKVSHRELADLAVRTKYEGKLRHVPLLLLYILATRAKGPTASGLTSKTIAEVIYRPDEMGELLAISAKFTGSSKKFTHQIRKGIALAWCKFDEYQLSKWNRDAQFKLKDVMRLTHPKPNSEEQVEMWARLLNDELKVAETWETALSNASDKKAAVEDLLNRRKIGYFALLSNLVSFTKHGVNEDLIQTAILERRGANGILPFRFIAAARACPRFEPYLDLALMDNIKESHEFNGKTLLLIDVSGSMDRKLSGKSTLTRMDAAAILGSMFLGDARVFTFSEELVEVPHRYGMAGVDVIVNSQFHSGTKLGAAVQTMKTMDHDRLIVITDEQSHDRVPDPKVPQSYMINVASARNGVGYGKWNHIDGFSENIFNWIKSYEE